MAPRVASLGAWRWAASPHDIVNTIIWPSVLLVVGRYLPVVVSNRS